MKEWEVWISAEEPADVNLPLDFEEKIKAF